MHVRASKNVGCSQPTWWRPSRLVSSVSTGVDARAETDSRARRDGAAATPRGAGGATEKRLTADTRSQRCASFCPPKDAENHAEYPKDFMPQDLPARHQDRYAVTYRGFELTRVQKCVSRAKKRGDRVRFSVHEIESPTDDLINVV